MKTQNMTSPRGNKVPNQFEISDETYLWFQSYETIIARINKRTRQITLDLNAWNYSTTTSKYRNKFLGMTTQETKKT